jgi:hypothetical protein
MQFPLTITIGGPESTSKQTAQRLVKLNARASWLHLSSMRTQSLSGAGEYGASSSQTGHLTVIAVSRLLALALARAVAPPITIAANTGPGILDQRDTTRQFYFTFPGEQINVGISRGK